MGSPLIATDFNHVRLGQLSADALRQWRAYNAFRRFAQSNAKWKATQNELQIHRIFSTYSSCRLVIVAHCIGKEVTAQIIARHLGKDGMYDAARLPFRDVHNWELTAAFPEAVQGIRFCWQSSMINSELAQGCNRLPVSDGG